MWWGFASSSNGKESACSARGKTPWRRTQQPTPGFLPGESHRQRSLAGYSPVSSLCSRVIEGKEGGLTLHRQALCLESRHEKCLDI